MTGPEPRPIDRPTRLRERVRRSALAFGLGFGLCVGLPVDARAVLIATGDGTGNTGPPAADPGFDNVGRIGVLSGVYVRNGWVLTASHVGAKTIELKGEFYDPVPGSRVQFQDGVLGGADLIAFKILDAKPPLPALAITDTEQTIGTDVTLIGNGLKRGAQLPPIMGNIGWDWAVGWITRWGTNKISAVELEVGTTRSVAMKFDRIVNPVAGQHESAFAHGDSGGAVFTGSGASAELVGIMWGQSAGPGQPAQGASYYENSGIAADLFSYRTDILALIDQPDCSDGLDDDGDGFVDHPNDPGCSDALDSDERGPAYECDNGIDDDGDGAVDFPNDIGCESPTGTEPNPTVVPTSSIGAGALAIVLYAQAQRILRSESVHVD
jgi:hypothetical protein